MLSWPGRFEGGEGFRLTFADLAPDPNGDPGVTRARFAGTDAQGRPLLITAEHAVQESGGFDIFQLKSLQADMTLDNGIWLSVIATGGVFDRGQGSLHLQGPIQVFTSVGYELHAEEAIIDLDKGAVTTDGPINGHGPLGNISAGTMQFTTGNGGGFAFSSGVRVLLNPTRQR